MTFDPGPVFASQAWIWRPDISCWLTTFTGQKKTFRNLLIIQTTQQDNNFTKESKVVEDISDEYFFESNS